PLMDGARNDLRHALRKAAIQDARIPVYANVSGRPVRKAEDIRTLLEAQLTSAVRWDESVRNMIADGATTFVEVGPGKVLQSLVKRISEAAEVRGIDTIEDIQQSVPA
ncbi:MAG TPA: [acyl-carrier-protein] S-malonyltransferase, partial [Bacteroidota bacterium]|nr:[acyl-carrier-protein] S-malonyltransferase [Bacteroidota bacterium]